MNAFLCLYAALFSDSSDDEPLSELVRKKSELEMKQAVVLLERMSEQDVMDAVARGRAHSQEQKRTARGGNDRLGRNVRTKLWKESR